MKTIKIKVLLILAAIILVPVISNAQNEYKKYFVNGDWQFNIPLNNDFTSKGSGWGMSFDGGYFFAPKFGVGLFMAYSTNHKYINTATFPVESNSTITTNQQRSLFQLPFGVVFRYRPMNSGWFDPYGAVKIGTEYAKLMSYISTYQVKENTWGFYISPEIGSNFWFTNAKNFGMNASIYYSFSTNKGKVLNGDVDKLNNFGFRIGLAF